MHNSCPSSAAAQQKRVEEILGPVVCIGEARNVLAHCDQLRSWGDLGMANAVRVTDQTAHGAPLNGAGSPDVLIGNMPAWRALPAGVGDGLEDASKAVKEIMDKPPFMPPDVASKLPEIQAKMMQTAAKAAQAGNPAAASGVTTAFTTLMTTTVGLTAAYTAGAAVPGGEPAARTAFTMGLKAALSSASAAAVSAIAGSWDMHTCPMATPMPHGPGLMTRGAATVFINGLPAGLSDQMVFEAAGGPVGISAGCPTVLIGDGGGGGGGGAGSDQGKQSSSRQKGADSSQPSSKESVQRTASNAEAPSAADEEELHTVQIHVVDPETNRPASNCRFRLWNDSAEHAGKLDGDGSAQVQVEAGDWQLEVDFDKTA